MKPRTAPRPRRRAALGPILLLFPFLLLTTSPLLGDDPVTAGFIQQSRDLLARGNASNLLESVEKNRGTTYEAVDSLLAANPPDGLALSDALGRAYHEAFDDPRLLERVSVFAHWTEGQRATRRRAVALKEAAKSDYAKGRVTEAAAKFKQALALFRQIGDVREEGRCLSNLGSMAVVQGDGATAERWSRQAEQTVSRSGDLSLLIPIRINRAYSQEDQGQIEAARTTLESALKEAREWGDKEGEAAILVNMVSVAEGMGNWDEALRLAEAQAEVGRALGKPEIEATAWNNQGAIYSDRGDFKEALPRFEKAIEISHAGGLVRQEAEFEVTVASVYRRMDDHDRAQIHIDRARKAAVSMEHPVTLARIDLGEASLMVEEGKYKAALPLLERAEARLKDRDDGGSLPTVHEVRGVAYYYLGRYPGAVSEFKLAIREHERSARVGLGADAHRNLAMCQYSLGETSAAVKELETASRMHEQVGDPRGRSLDLNALGVLRYRVGDFAGARKALDAALALVPQNTDRTNEGEILCDMAAVELAMGPPHRASAIDLLGRASALFKETSDALGTAHVATLLAEAQLASGDPAAARSTLANARAVAGDRRASEFEWKLLDLEARVAEAQREEKEAGLKYAAAVGEVERLRGGVGPDLWRAAILEDRIAPYRSLSRWYRRHGDLEEAYRIARLAKARTFVERLTPPALTEDYAETSLPERLVPAPAAPLATIQSRLEQGQLLIDFFFDDSGLVAFVAGRDTFKAQEIPESGDGKTLAGLLEVLKYPGRPVPGQEAVTRAWRSAASRAGSLLMEPLLEEMQSRQHLYIAPNGALHGVPFAALEVRGRMVVEQWSLSILPAAEALLGRRTSGASDTAGEGMLVLGDPASGEKSGALPGAAEEARKIAAEEGPAVSLYLGQAASEAVFRELAPVSSRIHVAAHARVDPLSPARSYLQLAPGAEFDGRLEAVEIASLPLQADLVVLSGCETGKEGGLSRGAAAGDERTGLTRAFLAAGAQSVIATLWDMDDRTARAFMPELYPLLEHRSPSQALAELQRRLIAGKLRDASGRTLSHPFYWASLVDYGSR